MAPQQLQHLATYLYHGSIKFQPGYGWMASIHS